MIGLQNQLQALDKYGKDLALDQADNMFEKAYATLVDAAMKVKGPQGFKDQLKQIVNEYQLALKTSASSEQLRDAKAKFINAFDTENQYGKSISGVLKASANDIDSNEAFIKLKTSVNDLYTTAEKRLKAQTVKVDGPKVETKVQTNNESLKTQIQAQLDMIEKAISDGLTNKKAVQNAKKLLLSASTGNDAETYKKEFGALNDKFKDLTAKSAKSAADKQKKLAAETNAHINELNERAAKLRADRTNREMDEDERKQIEKARSDAELADKKAEDELKKDTESLKQKGASAAKIAEATSIWDSIIAETHADGLAKIADAEEKYAKKQTDRAEKSAKELVKTEKETLQARLEAVNLVIPETLTTSSTISKLNERAELEIAILRKENEAKIQEFVNGNKDYEKALEAKYLLDYRYNERKQALDKLLAASTEEMEADALEAHNKSIADATEAITGLEDKLKSATDNVSALRDKLMNSEYVVSIKTNETRSIKTIYSTTDETQQSAILNGIESQAEREREIKLLAARKTLRQELQDAKDNNNLKHLAYVKYLNTEADAYEEHRAKVRTIGEAMAIDLAQSYSSAMRSMTVPDNSQALAQAKANLAGYKNEEESLKRSLLRREITSQEYYDKQKELRDKALEEERKANDLRFNFWKSMTDNMASVFDSMLKKNQAAQAKTADEYGRILSVMGEKRKEAAELSALLAEQERAGACDAADATANKLIDVNASILAGEKELNKKKNELYAESGVAFGATLGFMLASHKSFLQSTLAASLAAMKAQIPILVTLILGKEFATKSILGIATAAVLTGLLYAAASVAEAAVSSAKFARGVVNLQGAGTTTSDSIPARLSLSESVITAKGTLAAGNADAFRWVNSTGASLREYYLHDSTIEKFYQDKFERATHVERERAERLEAINKRLARDNQRLQRADGLARLAAERIVVMKSQESTTTTVKLEESNKRLEAMNKELQRSNELMLNNMRLMNDNFYDLQKTIKSKQPVEITGNNTLKLR